MLIRIKHWSEIIEKDVKKGIPLSELHVKGTLYVICGPKGSHAPMPDFTTIDGFIQFMHVALDYCINSHGEPDPAWKKVIDDIHKMGDQLQDKNVRFTGNTKKEFAEYTRQVSTVFNKSADPLPRLSIKATTSDDIRPFMKKCIAAQNDIGYWFDTEYYDYDPKEGSGRLFVEELMNQLSNLKMEKSRGDFNISYYLMAKGYHENVYDAMNLLVGTAVYAINCSSTRKCDAYDFDIYETEKFLKNIRSIMKNTIHVV